MILYHVNDMYHRNTFFHNLTYVSIGNSWCTRVCRCLWIGLEESRYQHLDLPSPGWLSWYMIYIWWHWRVYHRLIWDDIGTSVVSFWFWRLCYSNVASCSELTRLFYWFWYLSSPSKSLYPHYWRWKIWTSTCAGFTGSSVVPVCLTVCVADGCVCAAGWRGKHCRQGDQQPRLFCLLFI